ncbi:uncharacterized protein LOC114265327 [Camellia sinensis]|uniref:uncharacterized protein LOC114265327 n=1 Tax=Camellia sinensis TaxID=4442 RepID=UPI001036F0BA|nr:uncharacterized protein LOC114265327 [Camellia sinensis]
MEETRTVETSETFDARMDRLERMVEFLTEALRQQQRQPFPLPPLPPILVEPPNNEQKVLLATFTLQEEARRWWMLDQNQQTAMCVRDRKVIEFEQLKQGTMIVAEYEAKFTELVRYAPHMVDTEYKKATKFKGGLDVEVLDRVNVLKLEKYVDVLDRSIIAEANVVVLRQAKAPVVEWKGKRPGSNFKKGWNNFNIQPNKRQNTGSFPSSSQGNDIPICPECGKRHKGVCRRISGACFRCEKIGHMIKDCPLVSQSTSQLKASSTASVSTPRVTSKATTIKETLKQGRVFALVPSDV